MNAYVLMRDGYLEGVFVANEAIKPRALLQLKSKADKVGMDLYEAHTDAVSELEAHLDSEAAELEKEQ